MQLCVQGNLLHRLSSNLRFTNLQFEMSVFHLVCLPVPEALLHLHVDQLLHSESWHSGGQGNISQGLSSTLPFLHCLPHLHLPLASGITVLLLVCLPSPHVLLQVDHLFQLESLQLTATGHGNISHGLSCILPFSHCLPPLLASVITVLLLVFLPFPHV